MGKRHVEYSVRFDEDVHDLTAEAIAKSIEVHLRRTGHPALRQATVEVRREITA